MRTVLIILASVVAAAILAGSALLVLGLAPLRVVSGSGDGADPVVVDEAAEAMPSPAAAPGPASPSPSPAAAAGSPSPSPSPSASPEPTPDPQVAEVQQQLIDLGYYPGPVDGFAGSGTASAVMAFQKVNGISADGVIGPQTLAALVEPLTPTLAGGAATRIEIDLTLQVVHLVKDGQRIRTMPTSSGNGATYTTAGGGKARALTPIGDFHIERRISGVREAPLGVLYDPLYFYRGWALHGSNHVPPYPASHGCARLTRADALWLAAQVPDGTQVRVYGGQHVFTPGSTWVGTDEPAGDLGPEPSPSPSPAPSPTPAPSPPGTPAPSPSPASPAPSPSPSPRASPSPSPSPSPDSGSGLIDPP